VALHDEHRALSPDVRNPAGPVTPYQARPLSPLGFIDERVQEERTMRARSISWRATSTTFQA